MHSGHWASRTITATVWQRIWTKQRSSTSWQQIKVIVTHSGPLVLCIRMVSVLRGMRGGQKTYTTKQHVVKRGTGTLRAAPTMRKFRITIFPPSLPLTFSNSQPAAAAFARQILIALCQSSRDMELTQKMSQSLGVHVIAPSALSYMASAKLPITMNFSSRCRKA